MGVVPFLGGRDWQSQTLVIFADFQQEYVAGGRALAIHDTEACLANCRRWLAAAREIKLPIVHFRQIKRGVYFNEALPFSQWIDDFQPRSTEMLYERGLPSCYANEDFAALVDRIAAPLIVLAGLAGDQACLATAIDANHRRHCPVVIRDCSATSALGHLTEAASHEAVCHVISRYAEVLTLEQLLRRLHFTARAKSRVESHRRGALS